MKGGNPVQILVVDDTPTNIEVLAGALSREYTVKFATNGEKALEMANRPEKPDLILLDVMMPGMDGYEVCRRLKENPDTRNIPVMFITARSDMEDQIRGYQVGGVDFISKPFQIPIVLARVSAQLRLKLHSDLLESRAFIDGLTGIANRRHMDEVLENECRRAQRNKMALSLLMIDVDHFKEYNDHYGHGAGDECLRQIGGVLAMMPMRPGDFVARYGGEEFSVILPGCNITGAQIIAERIRVTIEALNLPHAHSTTARHVTVSIGCATSRQTDELTPERLLAAADQALYQAKQQGRNRVVCPLPEGT
ncbi:diguanylate cyclase response regulator [Halothiobacillus diazotrophicus]|uniref:diguanylate cyclase n=1 Tax=Halothiobacillus diazotrophicus TaxID=1860122 RepID=A0A191ZJZ5_9GAMM|nr:diguanylate cyclase response regulator [Halothiobacillus diazotrophicus]